MDKLKPVITIEMEGGGRIKVELDPENAPNTVRNFIALAEGGFYDGLIFHRVIPGFMIQGGCPQGTGRGGPGYSIKGEFASNGHKNEIVHNRGVISMARSQLPNSAGSQFFITVANAPHLDGQYAAFGVVIEGMDVADKIVAVQRDRADKPLKDQRIRTVTVEKNGVDYEPPEKA
ncbi:MAG: peptidylprolyl isomerase [Dethiobacteria bacterium]|jgi:peptidyl-prolyl cis-trans isomerase B (cyclophilin B)